MLGSWEDDDSIKPFKLHKSGKNSCRIIFKTNFFKQKLRHQVVVAMRWKRFKNCRFHIPGCNYQRKPKFKIPVDSISKRFFFFVFFFKKVLIIGLRIFCVIIRNKFYALLYTFLCLQQKQKFFNVYLIAK